MVKVLIAGGPKTGKTTLAEKIASRKGWPVYHTDDLIEEGWSEASESVAYWIEFKEAPCIIEGVAVPRAIRKWLDYPNTKADLELILLTNPHGELTKGQLTMTKGLETVMREIGPHLAFHDIRIIVNPDEKIYG